MCKTITSEIIIGNFIIDSIKNKKEVKSNVLEISNLINFEKRLSDALTEDYCSEFTLSDLFLFQQNYPFLLEKIDDDNLYIIDTVKNDDVLKQLNRYFRIGVPSKIIQKMEMN